MKTGTQFSMCIISNFIQDEVVTDADGRLLLLMFLTLLAWSGLLRAAEISGVSSRRRGRTHVSYLHMSWLLLNDNVGIACYSTCCTDLGFSRKYMGLPLDNNNINCSQLVMSIGRSLTQ